MYRDSTADVASLYARHGFKMAERLSMALESVDVRPVVSERRVSFNQIGAIGFNRKNVKQSQGKILAYSLSS